MNNEIKNEIKEVGRYYYKSLYFKAEDYIKIISYCRKNKISVSNFLKKVALKEIERSHR